MSNSIILLPNNKKLALFKYNNNYYKILYRSGLGVSINILNSSFDLISNWVQHYSKVNVVFLQLHQYTSSKSNKLFIVFLKTLKERLASYYNTPNIGSFWVREESTTHKQHYHLIILVSGHRCKSGHIISELTNEIWTQQDSKNFTYHVKKRVYKIVRNGSDIEYAALLTRLSYFAKNETKLKLAERHCFGRSQLIK